MKSKEKRNPCGRPYKKNTLVLTKMMITNLLCTILSVTIVEDLVIPHSLSH